MFTSTAGLVGHVFQTGVATVFARDDPRLNPVNRSLTTHPEGSMIISPLKHAGEVAGVLVIVQRESADPLSDRDVTSLEVFASAASTAVDLASKPRAQPQDGDPRRS